MTEADTTTSTARNAPLARLEAPLSELETRLRFLTGFFEARDAYGNMDSAALHLFLTDCSDAATKARALWGEAWKAQGGTDA